MRRRFCEDRFMAAFELAVMCSLLVGLVLLVLTNQ